MHKLYLTQSDTSLDNICQNDISQNHTYDSNHEKRKDNNILEMIHDVVYMIMNVTGCYQQLHHHDHHHRDDHHRHHRHWYRPRCPNLYLYHQHHLPSLHQIQHNLDLHEDHSRSAKKKHLE